MDSWPNQEALNRALNIYRTYMRAFIIFHLKKIPGEKVEDVVFDSLDAANQSDRADEIDRMLHQSDRDIKSIIDINDFPHLVHQNWDSAFKRLLSDDKDFRNQLWLIKTCRDQDFAHPPEGDAESEGTRAHLFLIADVLGKIKKPDAKHNVETIQDKLFSDDTKERLAEAREHLKAAEAGNAEHKNSLAESEKRLKTAESERVEYEKHNANLSKQVDEKEKRHKKLSQQLKRAKTENDKYKKNLAGAKQRLKKSEAAQADYKERLKTTSKELKEAKAERKKSEERLATVSNELTAVQAEKITSEERLAAMRELFTAATIKSLIFPPFGTDSAVRILDRRGTDKRNYLLELLEQKQPSIIYVQSEEEINQLLAFVGPEKAGVIGKHDEQTCDAEETQILEELKDGKLIAIVSSATFSKLASSHYVEHFVFCHLTPGLDVFFNRCQPTFTSAKNAYLHLIYNSKEDIERLNQWLTQKYPNRETLEKLYTELRKLAKTNGSFIKPEDIYNELDIAKLGIETGLAIFEELRLLERNENGIKLLSPSGEKLDNSKIHDKGEKLKQGIAEVHAFQLEQSIEKIWEEILKEIKPDGEQSLYQVDLHKAHLSISESNNAVSDETMEAGLTPKPSRANAKVTVEQVREIRSRSAAGESYSKIAREFDLTPAGIRNIVLRNTWKHVE